MRFADFTDFKDFITKNKMTPEQGLTFLENELKNKEKKEYESKPKARTEGQ